MKNKTIGVLLMIICTFIQLLAKLTIKKAFLQEEVFITIVVFDFMILTFALTLMPKLSKGFKSSLLFKNTFFVD